MWYISLSLSFSFTHSPYAYQFGLGKRADGYDISNYDDEIYGKDDLNQENWSDGGMFDNKNDIDVFDSGYDNVDIVPRGEEGKSFLINFSRRR